jgi:hypothetical protein
MCFHHLLSALFHTSSGGKPKTGAWKNILWYHYAALETLRFGLLVYQNSPRLLYLALTIMLNMPLF